MSLADFQSRVDDLVRDKDGVISSTQRGLAIDDAVRRYSQDFPRQVTVDLTSAGGQGLALPAGWQTGYSQALAFEYPIDEVPASEIPLGEVKTRQRPSGLAFELPESLPAAAVVRVTYTQRHAVDESTDTVPEDHRLAVCCWAAAILCGELHAYYATESAPTLGADTADHQGKSERFRTRQRDLSAQYCRDLGVQEKRPQHGHAVVPLQRNDSQGNPRLFRGRRLVS